MDGEALVFTIRYWDACMHGIVPDMGVVDVVVRTTVWVNENL
jgi:hypothetical protein